MLSQQISIHIKYRYVLKFSLIDISEKNSFAKTSSKSIILMAGLAAVRTRYQSERCCQREIDWTGDV